MVGGNICLLHWLMLLLESSDNGLESRSLNLLLLVDTLRWVLLQIGMGGLMRWWKQKPLLVALR